MSYLLGCLLSYYNYSYGWYAILRMESLSCEVGWVAWLQLPYGAVVFNVLASNGTLLVVVPALSASSILSYGINYISKLDYKNY